MTSSRKLGPALISTRDSEEERHACLASARLCEEQESDTADGLSTFPTVGGNGDTALERLLSTAQPSPLVDKDLSLNSALTSVGTQSETNTNSRSIADASPSAVPDQLRLAHSETAPNQQHQFFERPREPQVSWAQADTHITLEIHLKNVEFYDIYIEEFGRSLGFAASVRTESDAEGASQLGKRTVAFDEQQQQQAGPASSDTRVDAATPTNTLQSYYFRLDLFAEVNEDNYEVFELDQSILLIFEKIPQQATVWPRLTLSPNELSWLARISDENYRDLRSLLCDNYVDNDSVVNTPSGIGKQVSPSVNEPSAVRRQEHLRQQPNKEHRKNCQLAGSGTTTSHSIPPADDIQNCDPPLATSTGKSKQRTTTRPSARINYSKTSPHTSRDIFNPFKRNINRFNHTNSRRASNSSPGNIDNNNSTTMKHDHRRDTSGLESSKNMSRHPLDFKRTYLFLYNLALFVMFLKVYIILLIKTLSGTMDDETVQGTAFIIKLLTYTQLMESIHPMLGLVPGGWTMPLLQAIGRLLVNLFLADPTIRVNSAPNAHLLFIVWSTIEIFRYSYYALRVFKVEVYPLTWCRYSLFLPLYPMGGFFESQVIFATIKQYEKTGAYSIGLPNSANFSFSLPSFLRFYTFVLLGPSILYLIRYMLSQRAKQLKRKVD